MASNISLGKGDLLSATTTEQTEYLVPNPVNGAGNNDFCDRLHIWNEGPDDVRIQVNVEDASRAGDFTVATAMLIPADKDDYIFNLRNPIKKFAYATESGTATIKYSAS